LFAREGDVEEIEITSFLFSTEQMRVVLLMGTKKMAKETKKVATLGPKKESNPLEHSRRFYVGLFFGPTTPRLSPAGFIQRVDKFLLSSSSTRLG
jgi:hypothetical protein